MNKQRSLVAIAAFAILAGCAPTMGGGMGVSRSGAVHASMAWTANDSRTGVLTADLSTGQTYSGRYIQMTRETRVDDLNPLWDGWPHHRRWRGWDYWGPDYGPRFMTEYSGRVVANLASPDGQRMRCRFRLIQPASGMAGGGEGTCQLPSGDTIDASFPTA